MILLAKFLPLIGAKSLSLFGLFTFGRSTIQEWEKYFGIISPLKKDLTTPIRSFLIIYQQFLKKYPFEPSGPTIELGFIITTTSLSKFILGI